MVLKTGSLGIDIALGGGWRPGTLNEIWGDTGAGKTVLARHSADAAVRARQHVLWIDLAKAVAHMDNEPRATIGWPRNAEDAFEMALRGTEVFGLIVVDPTQNLVRQRELDGDPEYVPHPQREYRLELNEVKAAAAKHGATVLFVGQPRDKEREPVRGTGISEKVSWRVHLHPDVIHQDGTRDIVASVKDVPGKVTRHEVARYTVVPGSGIDARLEMVDLGISYDVIVQRGTWLAWNNVQRQGRREMARALDYPLMLDLDQEIRIHAGIC